MEKDRYVWEKKGRYILRLRKRKGNMKGKMNMIMRKTKTMDKD